VTLREEDKVLSGVDTLFLAGLTFPQGRRAPMMSVGQHGTNLVLDKIGIASTGKRMAVGISETKINAKSFRGSTIPSIPRQQTLRAWVQHGARDGRHSGELSGKAALQRAARRCCDLAACEERRNFPLLAEGVKVLTRRVLSDARTTQDPELACGLLPVLLRTHEIIAGS